MNQVNTPTTNGKVIALAVAGAFGGFLFGFDSSVINGAVNAIQDEYALTATLTGFAVASALLGAAAGAYLGGRIGDRFGRIPVMLLGSIMFFVSSVGSAFAFSVYDLVLWRIVGGLGIGLASVVAPAYIAEISPRTMRGRLGSLQQLAITIGIFSALLSDALFANTAGGASEASLFGIDAWRWMFLACAVPAGVYFVIAKILPESPRFLVLKDRETEARAVFTRVWPDGDVDREIRDIRASIQVDRRAQRSGSFRGTSFGLRPIVWAGIILSVFQQFVGINVIFYYSNILWEAVGFSEADSFKITVITAVVNIATTIIAIATIDRVGRKPLLVIGSVGMAVTLGMMSLIFGIARTTTDASGAVTPVLEGWQAPTALISANIFVVAFGMSWGPVVWVLLGESFPNRIRAAALSIAAAAQWVANWAITVSFPKMKDISLSMSYGFYAACALLSLFFVIKWVRETKGKELEDMDDQLA